MAMMRRLTAYSVCMLSAGMHIMRSAHACIPLLCCAVFCVFICSSLPFPACPAICTVYGIYNSHLVILRRRNGGGRCSCLPAGKQPATFVSLHQQRGLQRRAAQRLPLYPLPPPLLQASSDPPPTPLRNGLCVVWPGQYGGGGSPDHAADSSPHLHSASFCSLAHQMVYQWCQKGPTRGNRNRTCVLNALPPHPLLVLVACLQSNRGLTPSATAAAPMGARPVQHTSRHRALHARIPFCPMGHTGWCTALCTSALHCAQL